MRCGAQPVHASAVNAERRDAELHEVLGGAGQIAACEETVDIVHRIKLRRTLFFGVGALQKKLLLGPAAKPCLEEAGEHAVVGGGGPSSDCRRGNHPLQEAVEDIMGFDNISVAPGLGRWHKHAETYMRAADAGRS